MIGVLGRGDVDEVASAEWDHGLDKQAADGFSGLADHFVVSEL